MSIFPSSFSFFKFTHGFELNFNLNIFGCMTRIRGNRDCIIVHYHFIICHNRDSIIVHYPFRLYDNLF